MIMITANDPTKTDTGSRPQGRFVTGEFVVYLEAIDSSFGCRALAPWSVGGNAIFMALWSNAL